MVSSILAVLSAIISLSVAGRGTESRAAVKVADEGTIQKAVDRYSGEHPQGRYPTLNGCAPGLILDLISKECVFPGQETDPTRTDSENLEFAFVEVASGIDLNGDGDIEDSFTVAPIIWHKAFDGQFALSDEVVTKRFLGDYVPRSPKHAFEFLAGSDDSWEDGENIDPDDLGNVLGDPSRITAPVGLVSGPNGINVVSDQVPVWVIGAFEANSGFLVKNLLPEGRY